jgi:O-antigen/teichoic acid export membrane protein
MTGRHAAVKPHRRQSAVRRQMAGRLSWGIADQAMSSVGNFLLGVFVARLLGAESLGALGLAFVAYAIALNCSRALSTDALMVRFSAAGKDSWRGAVAAAGGVALLVGVACGALCVLLGLALKMHTPGSEAGAAFIALGIVLPGLMLQDSWRSAFFAAGKGAKTFLNDTVWTVLMVGVLALGYVAHFGGITFALLVFGGTAWVAGLFGIWQARIVPRPALAVGWLRRHRDLGLRFLVENVVLGAGGQIRSLVVAATGGLAAAGAIRGAEMLIGPVVALLMGVGQVAVPEAARALTRGQRALMRLAASLSGGLASIALAWGVVVIVVFPLGLGQLVLGDVWPEAQVLVLGVIVSSAAGCTQVGPSAALRALGRADLTMQCQIVVTSLFVGMAAVGAILWDAQGAVWGTAIASVLGAGIWWARLRKAEREHFAVTDWEPVGTEGAAA